MFNLRKKAVSIIETVIAVTIFLILMGIVFRALVTSRNIFLKSSARSYLVGVANNALEQIRKDLAETNVNYSRISSNINDLNVNSPTSSGPVIIFSVPTDTDSDGSVLTSAGVLQWGAGVGNNSNYRIRYRMDTVNRYLMREIITCSGSAGSYSCNVVSPASDNAKIIAQRVSSVTPIVFTRVSTDTAIEVNLNLNDTKFTSGDVKTSQTIRVKLRN